MISIIGIFLIKEEGIERIREALETYMWDEKPFDSMENLFNVVN